MEVQATSLMMKNLCMSKTRYAKMERERDRHKGRYVLFKVTTVITIATTNLY